jgi:hypothetical protein
MIAVLFLAARDYRWLSVALCLMGTPTNPISSLASVSRFFLDDFDYAMVLGTGSHTLKLPFGFAVCRVDFSQAAGFIGNTSHT